LKLFEINIDKNRIILHTIFWIVWVVSFTIIQSVGNNINEWFMWLMYYVITLPIFITHTYLIAYWLLPKLFSTHRYWLFIASIFLLLILFSVIELIISNELVFKVFDSNNAFPPGYLNLKNIIISGIGNHYIILVFFAIKAGRSWYSVQNKKDELLQTKMETDLEIYHYQLQPKLVLTLIEELEILSDKSPEKAPEMIVKISNFLNHFLFEGKEDLLPLTTEVNLIEEFLSIHEYALEGRLISNFVVNGMLQSFVVPPLLLIPYINCAIKLAYECNNSFESTVIIKAEKKYLLFTFTFWSEKKFRLFDNENIEVTKKRLKYNYPGKHRLIENIDENFREVSLEVFY